MDIRSNKLKMMVHLHKEDDAMVLIQLAREFGIKAIANHCVDVHRQKVFVALREASIPVIDGPMDSFPYKVELKHESWKNVEKLLKSAAKFSMMSDHPVILQRNLFYSLRHLLRFGLSKAEAISKVISEPAEIIGAHNIREVRPDFKASFVVWSGDPFSLTSHPIMVVAEGNVVYEEQRSNFESQITKLYLLVLSSMPFIGCYVKPWARRDQIPACIRVLLLPEL